jgi:hypothetical protein
VSRVRIVASKQFIDEVFRNERAWLSVHVALMQLRHSQPSHELDCPAEWPVDYCTDRWPSSPPAHGLTYPKGAPPSREFRPRAGSKSDWAVVRGERLPRG